MLSDGKSSHETTIIDLTFDQTVTFTEVFFPPPSLTTFLTELGGSLGLWLGVGIIQLCTFAVAFFNFEKITHFKSCRKELNYSLKIIYDCM